LRDNAIRVDRTEPMRAKTLTARYAVAMGVDDRDNIPEPVD
jgi:hypothetical protein